MTYYYLRCSYLVICKQLQTFPETSTKFLVKLSVCTTRDAEERQHDGEGAPHDH